MYAFFNTHIANYSLFTNYLNADIFFFSILYKLNGGLIADLRGVMTSVVEADTMMVDIRCMSGIRENVGRFEKDRILLGCISRGGRVNSSTIPRKNELKEMHAFNIVQKSAIILFS